jgi:hypothetical protein
MTKTRENIYSSHLHAARCYLVAFVTCVQLAGCIEDSAQEGGEANSVMTGRWSIKADYAGSCSCEVTCQCFFGTPPPLGYCETTGLVELKRGHYGDVDLSGLSVVYATSFAKWMKIYVSEHATDAQLEILPSVIAKLDNVFAMTEVVSVERAAISVARSEGRVKFSLPTTQVEIEMMKGVDDKPIKIANLPQAYLRDHTQYRTIENRHESHDQQYSHKGTDGFTSRIEIAGEL